MLTNRYMVSVKNLPAIMQKVVQGTAPDKFSQAHLNGIGFKSSNDKAVIPLLKDLKFLSEDGTPTKRYHDYRDPSRSKQVMGEALKVAYEDLFHLNARPSDADRSAIEGKFKSFHNTTDNVAQRQAATFLALLKLAALDGTSTTSVDTDLKTETKEKQPKKEKGKDSNREFGAAFAGLRYNVEIHLPASKDIEVYNAIFKALKEHLFE
jgi:hypothetical protein